MPRCFSISIQSDVAWRALLRAFTVPASWIAPPKSSSFSVSVVLPASGWEMIANVRRRATSRARSADCGTRAMAVNIAGDAGCARTKTKPPAGMAGGDELRIIPSAARACARADISRSVDLAACGHPNGRTPISGPCRNSAKPMETTRPMTTAIASCEKRPAAYVVPACRSRRRRDDERERRPRQKTRRTR